MKLLSQILIALSLMLLLPSELKGQLSISADTTAGCVPLTVNFTANAPGATGYQWDLGGGVTSVQQNPSRVFLAGGVYSISLTVTYAGGRSTTITRSNYITVHTPPNAAFSTTQLDVCAFDPVQFNNTSTPGSSPVQNWLWNFGDGNTSAAPAPAHPYTQAGRFTISLLATDANGCTNLAVRSSYVRVRKPDASFSYNNVLSCLPPLQSTFIPAVQGGLTHLWLFGNGSFSPLPGPTHTYTTGGAFTVSHIVIDSLGCRDTLSIPNLVNIGQTITAPGLANKTIVCPNETVTFSCGNPSAVSNVWTIGTATINNCSFNRSFATPGIYNVTLRQTDASGCTVTATIPITVRSLPVINFVANSPYACKPPHTTAFTNLTSPVTGPRWFWSFGDGSGATSASPTHSYTQSGKYTVALSVIDTFGCVASLSKVDYVEIDYIEARVAASPAMGCKPLSVNFNDNSISVSPIVSRTWIFPGLSSGLTDTSAAPQRVYPDTGYFPVILVVQNARGCKDSVYLPKQIQVGDTVFADFKTKDTTVCGRNKVPFTSLSRGNVKKWMWYFGDGNVLDMKQGSNIYQDTGYFDVTLIVSDRGCRDSLRVDSAVHVLPSISKFEGELIGCDTPHTVNFVNKSLGASRWHWNFGTGNPADTSNLYSPTFTYRQEGDFPVSLITRNFRTGCVDTLIKTVRVKRLILNAAQDKTYGCVPANVIFTDSSVNGSAWLWTVVGYDQQFASPSLNFSFPPPASTTNPTPRPPGIFRVRLQVFNDIGCEEDTIFTVRALRPTVDFNVPDSSVCAGTAVNFVNRTTSVAPVATWNWDFGDGRSSTQSAPVHRYTAPGRYSVTLRATDTAGCTHQRIRNLYLYVTQPIARATLSDTVSCTAGPIIFTSNSVGQTPLVHNWSLGNALNRSTPFFTHTYANNGRYLVSLTVIDTIGCDSTINIPVRIATPSVAVNASGTFANCPPLVSNFTHINQSGHPFSRWYWDFGDANASSVTNPTNLYANPGLYTVTHSAYTANGCTATVVLPNPVRVLGPTGSLTASPGAGCLGTLFSFSATTQSTLSNQIDMGDGTVYAGSPLLGSVTHRYTQPGTYLPAMVLDDGQGCRLPVRLPSPIVVYALPTADFVPGRRQLCDSGRVQFSDRSVSASPLLAWEWDFGDGATATGPNPLHTYLAPGSYTVTLRVRTADGCSDTLIIPAAVRVFQSPTARIGIADTGGCVPFRALARDLSSAGDAPLTARRWLGGFAGGSSVLPVDTFAFTTAGMYRLRLIVTDTAGCQDSASQWIEAFPLPRALFSVLPDSFGCAPASLQFVNQSSGTVQQWLWSFGDGNTSAQINPAHVYAADGNYTVSLQVTDEKGCTDKLEKPAYIRLAHPEADFESDTRRLCPGTPVVFSDRSRSDTLLAAWNWSFGDGNTATGATVTHRYAQAGFYTITLVVADVFGCTDTLTLPQHIEVLTDVQPEAPPIRWASVSSDQSIRIVWEAYANPLEDFARYILYRRGAGQPWTEVYSSNQLTSLDWTDNAVDTRSGPWCYLLAVENHCGTLSDTASSIAHCPVLLKVSARPGALQLDWTAYAGWPQVDAYEVYRANDYQPAAARRIGVAPGDTRVYVDSAHACPDSVTYRVSALYVPNGYTSYSNLRGGIPDINPPPPSQVLHMRLATVENNREIALSWDLPAVTQGEWIVLEKDAGSGYQQLSWWPYASGNTAYLDANVDVQRQPYGYRVFVRDICGLNTPLGREARSIHLQVEKAGGRITLNWTPYANWMQGVRRYRIEVLDERAGRFVPVISLPGSVLSFQDTLTQLAQAQYCYRVWADEQEGNSLSSLSNEACVSAEPVWYFPNAFSPNGDGINDVFLIRGVYIGNFQLRIYNRWGEMIYESQDIGAGWNGRARNGECPEGVYVFRAKGTGFDGKILEHTGTVTLIR